LHVDPLILKLFPNAENILRALELLFVLMKRTAMFTLAFNDVSRDEDNPQISLKKITRESLKSIRVYVDLMV